MGTLAACRAGSRCINVPGLRPGPRQDGARRPLTPYPLGKTARLRIDKPLNGWSDSPSGHPLLGGRECRCRELFNSGSAGVRLSAGGREIPR
jgi:hypothetical protein